MERNTLKKIHIAVNIIAWFTILVSVSVMFGWIFNLNALLRLMPEAASMKFNTALLFFITGLAALNIFKAYAYRRLINYLLAGILILIGTLTIIEYTWAINYGIDNILVSDNLSEIFPGRMSAATASCFIFIGIALTCIGSRYQLIKKIGNTMLLLIGIIALVAMVGYILQIPSENKLFFIDSMAIHTSSLFLINAVALSFINPELGVMGLLIYSKSGRRILTMLMPFVIVVPIIMTSLQLFLTNHDILEQDFGLSITTAVFIAFGIVYIYYMANQANKDEIKRKRLEESIKESNQELQLFKQALDECAIVAITDNKGVINYVNDQFCKIAKYSQQELVGKTHSIINSGFHSKSFFTNLWKTISQGKVWIGEIKNKAKDGSYYWVYTSIVPFRDNQGKVYQYLAIRQDITARKQAEELLSSQYVRKLELKNEELEQFAYIASHDLQEPLRTVNSFIGLLDRRYKGQLDANADKYLSFITEATNRMQNLIIGLLEYSRLGVKKSLQKVDCNELLKNIKEDLAPMIAETFTDIQSGELPVLKGYKTELRLLFQNIISNAIKFRKKDESPRIEIKAERKIDYWLFSVRDNGIGIEEKFASKIFVIFQQLHGRSEYEGSGIGLAHCKKIVNMHEGNIWVESEIMKGSTFYFTIKTRLEMMGDEEYLKMAMEQNEVYK